MAFRALIRINKSRNCKKPFSAMMLTSITTYYAMTSFQQNKIEAFV